MGDELHQSCQRRYQINDEIKNCEPSKASSDGIAAATEVLRIYFATLGAAANESNFTVDPGLEAISGAVSGIEGVDETQVAAVTGLAKVLSKLLLGAKREQVIRQLIDGEGERVRVVINSLLKEHVRTVLEDQLVTERSSLLTFYGQKIDQAGLNNEQDLRTICSERLASDRPILEFMIIRDFCERDALIEKRKRALAAYQNSLEKADQAMLDLQSGKAKLSGKELARRLYEVGDELKASVANVRAAFD
ncbi:MAG: hypothetical protein C0471_01090 [Erythrobacter sp.]|nr:hypothetical protein [Erythrobacter sp.]MBA4043009.1 hypothetical protein [Erythrobacter sp.]MBA4080517.1 hypothetical protein [Erythrobacter sp.]